MWSLNKKRIFTWTSYNFCILSPILKFEMTFCRIAIANRMRKLLIWYHACPTSLTASILVLSVIICLSVQFLRRQWSRNLSPMFSSSSRKQLGESQATILSGTQKALPFWEWKSNPLVNIVAVHSKRNLGICLTLVKLTYWPYYTILAEAATEISWIRNSHWFTFEMKYQWAVESFHIFWDIV